MRPICCCMCWTPAHQMSTTSEHQCCRCATLAMLQSCPHRNTITLTIWQSLELPLFCMLLPSHSCHSCPRTPVIAVKNTTLSLALSKANCCECTAFGMVQLSSLFECSCFSLLSTRKHCVCSHLHSQSLCLSFTPFEPSACHSQ